MAKDKTEKVKEIMHDPSKIRNIAIAAHIDHGKTTFSDNLLAGAGMMSEELAGKALVTDFHDDEQERGITIDTAAVSMVHDVGDKEYLINLLDTPGHVDFGGDVTRAMRAVDGCIVLVCASEGVMPQTETVLKQALKERVKPILFINKVDRLIKEIKLTPEQMQERFVKMIRHVNDLIEKMAPKEFKGKLLVNVQDGSVAFGSAYHNWALSIPFMKKHGITFKDVIESYSSGEEKVKELAKKAPLHKVVLNMVIEHLPNPKTAQKYRIPKIWHGDLESDIGKALMSCDEKGKPAFVCTKVTIDKQAGEISAGRLFSGTLKRGQGVFLNTIHTPLRLQQIFIYKGAQRVQIEEAVAGNIVGLGGLRGIYAGETVSEEEITPFEEIKHIFEPVVTKSIEPENPQDLPKLIEVLKQVHKEDPGIQIKINKETGENLISGMGELHLEIIENRIKSEKGIKIKASPPIVVYRETVSKKSPEIEGKSPNKHNKFYMTTEPMPKELYKAITEGVVSNIEVKGKNMELINQLQELGMDKMDARNVSLIYNGCIFMNCTAGIQSLNECIEMVKDAFRKVMDEGPLCREPCAAVIIKLNDASLHEDGIHRGPAQIIPAIRQAIHQGMMRAGLTLLEPKQVLRIDSPQDYMGNVSAEVGNRRGEIINVEQEEYSAVITAKLPVAELFGFEGQLKSATGGKGFQNLMDVLFERLPRDLLARVVGIIRERKGLSKEIPTAD
ncbi:MAG: elongation factor EF-2 [Candidatus Aenigmarchaeota archaeon]|nr:elongation factor EF-2 [Candidatus Aenigmarchaeota archaeon]